VQLPPEIREQLEQIASRFSLSQLREAAERMSASYHLKQTVSDFSEEISRAAYLLTRFPATYAACHAVLRYAAEIATDFAPKTMLDLGSGPGTAIAAASRFFPTISRVTAIEADPNIAVLEDAAIANGVEFEHLHADVRTTEFPKAELVTASYVLNEISGENRASFISYAWESCTGLLLIIEPGTPDGYERVLRVREQLLACGAHVVAPCPHVEKCPMAGTKDWCHFSARVERTSLHRQIKAGTLGHEDEKFSYMAFSRKEYALPQSRIVRHPFRGSGHIRFELCMDGKGLREQTVTRSQKPQYRAARKADWGDAWPAPILNRDGHDQQ
jgi:ribosomal protein RSM22 (predicted rRNA methylase)